MARFGFLEEMGKAFVPQKFHPYIRSYLQKAGIAEVPYTLFGGFFFASILATITLYFGFIYLRIADMGTLKFFALTFLFTFVVLLVISIISISIIYFYLDLKIFHRTKEMEKVLIEFLQFVSENLKGGMAFDRALWSSIKPQFTVLAKEVQIAAKKSMTGEDVEEALQEFTEKYESPMLNRSFSLIIEGMKGGGKISDVIDRVIDTLKNTKELKEDMAATALSYVIFITFIVIVISPMLFALSKQLLVILGGFAEKLGSNLSGAAVALPISFSSIAVTPEDFTKFSFGSLGVISLFSAIIISIIQNGDVKSGIKYIPLFIVLSLVFYVIFSYGLSIMMGAFF